jgi:hypothetical protein
MGRQMTGLFKQCPDVKVFLAVMVHRNDLARVLYQLCFREGWSEQRSATFATVTDDGLTGGSGTWLSGRHS